MLVLGSYLHCGLQAGSEVLKENVLAEGRVPVGECGGLVVLVADFLELLGIEFDEPRRSLFELPEAELIYIALIVPSTILLAPFM